MVDDFQKKYDALTEERASEVLELCDFVLDKIKVGWEVTTFMISKYSKNQILGLVTISDYYSGSEAETVIFSL